MSSFYLLHYLVLNIGASRTGASFGLTGESGIWKLDGYDEDDGVGESRVMKR